MAPGTVGKNSHALDSLKVLGGDREDELDVAVCGIEGEGVGGPIGAGRRIKDVVGLVQNGLAGEKESWRRCILDCFVEGEFPGCRALFESEAVNDQAELGWEAKERADGLLALGLPESEDLARHLAYRYGASQHGNGV